MSAMFLHLLGKDGIRATGGDDVIKDEHLLTLEKRLVKIHDAHLGNLLLSSSSALMNCQAVFHQDKMGITILDTTQSAYLLAELLVAALVHLLTTSLAHIGKPCPSPARHTHASNSHPPSALPTCKHHPLHP